jgi:predicted acyltransferase
MTTAVESQPVATPAQTATTTERLMSIDALRGFDMFWIIGAGSLVYALNQMSKSRVTQFLDEQLEHVEWEGFHFEDLIFPLFVFIVGVSLVFSLGKALDREGPATALGRVFRRGILLFAFGIFYSGGVTNAWPNIRVMGVLNRIALAYFFTGLLFCLFKPRTLAAICTGLLLGYWAMLTFIPIREIQLTKPALVSLAEKSGDKATAALFSDSGNPSTVKNGEAWLAAQKLFYGTTNRSSGHFAKGYNLTDHFDFQHLPGRKYDNFFDPEGILSTITAVCTCLLGVFAGLLLRNKNVPDLRKVSILIGCGIAAAVIGWLWNYQFPVIKKIWTSSYVLVAGGYSAILLGVFYLVVDVWKARTWCQPFVWMGMNSITIYLASNILESFRKIANRLAGGDIKNFFNDHVAQGFGELVIAIVGLLLAFWLVRFLYKHKIFLRV